MQLRLSVSSEPATNLAAHGKESNIRKPLKVLFSVL